MGKSDIEKRSETAQFTLSEIQKIITGFIPGGHVIDSFWNYRSGLKQQRIIEFSERLRAFIASEAGLCIDDFNFEREDFVNVFDAILEEVTRTKSELKLERFRNILIRSMQIEDDTDMSMVYVDITKSLHDIQIKLLELYYTRLEKERVIRGLVAECDIQVRSSKKHYNELLKKVEEGEIVPEESLSKAKNEHYLKEFELNEANTKREDYQNQFRHFYFHVSKGEFEYFKRDLISKGLLDEAFSEADEEGGRKRKIWISDFGKRYIHFIGFN